MKKAVPNIFTIFTEKHLFWCFPFGATQVLSCEYCKIFMSTYFEDYLRWAASEIL